MAPDKPAPASREVRRPPAPPPPGAFPPAAPSAPRDTRTETTEAATGSYEAHLVHPEGGLDTRIRVAAGETVLDAADRHGIDLPYSCRGGGCYACAARMTAGAASMPDQYVLEPDAIAAGFVLLCCTFLSEDAAFTTHQQDAVPG